MSSTITVQDILNQVNDYTKTYTTGTVDLGGRLRAVNRATEYAKRRMTLPSDETIFSFYFVMGQLYYTGPTDMNEPIALMYTNANNNTPRNAWRWVPYLDLLSFTGTNKSNLWSHTTINGFLQIAMIGYNLTTGGTLQTFTTLDGFTGINDAIDLSIDNNVYSVAPGSLEFSINPLLDNGKGSIYWQQVFDASPFFQEDGTIKSDVYMPSTNITSVNLTLYTDSSDYYQFTCDTTDTGSSFTINQWNRCHWSYLDGPTIVGSPNQQEINNWQIDIVESGSFGSSTISGWRIDNMFMVFPDQMTMVYNTMYKGTDTTGNTKKILFTSPTDIPGFQLYAPDLVDPIALRAAWILEPQLRADKDFMKMYHDECEAQLNNYGKIFPRKRTINLGQTAIWRP